MATPGLTRLVPQQQHQEMCWRREHIVLVAAVSADLWQGAVQRSNWVPWLLSLSVSSRDLAGGGWAVEVSDPVQLVDGIVTTEGAVVVEGEEKCGVALIVLVDEETVVPARRPVGVVAAVCEVELAVVAAGLVHSDFDCLDTSY